MTSKTCQTQEVILHTVSRKVGRKVVIVDTPGFDHSTLSDAEIFEMIVDWFRDL
jgi:GTPase Era involved in 16S rRNA processing